MTGVEEQTVHVNGRDYRVWRKGTGLPVTVFGGLGGYMKWTPFLEALSARCAVVVPSLPGFPGGGRAHVEMDTPLDWALEVRDLMNAVDAGPNLVGISFGGAIAADSAAIWPHKIENLVLVSPLGFFDVTEPSSDPWCVKPGRGQMELLCQDHQAWADHQEAPEGADSLEWEVSQIRANEAAARLLWPTGDIGVIHRVRRWLGATLILRGGNDLVLPVSYVNRFAEAGGGTVSVDAIPDAGHLADLDQPAALAGRILEFIE